MENTHEANDVRADWIARGSCRWARGCTMDQAIHELLRSRNYDGGAILVCKVTGDWRISGFDGTITTDGEITDRRAVHVVNSERLMELWEEIERQIEDDYTSSLSEELALEWSDECGEEVHVVGY